MRCNISRVNGNLRYRILQTDNKYYLIDMGESFWKLIFPFLFWFTSCRGYRIDEDTVTNIKSPSTKQANTGLYSLLGAGVSVLIANIIRPLVDSFIIQSSYVVNVIILIVILFTSSFILLYIYKLQKNNLNKIIDYTKLPIKRFKITPLQVSDVFKFTFIYLFLLSFTFFSFFLFVQYSNVLMLSFGIILFLLLIFSSGTPINEGLYKVKNK